MINYPVFVYEHGDISTYDNLEDVERDLEVIDVKNNEFVVYDSKATILELEVFSSFMSPDRVRVKESDEPVQRKGDFRNALETFLANCEKVDVQTLSNTELGELIKRVKAWAN